MKRRRAVAFAATAATSAVVVALLFLWGNAYFDGSGAPLTYGVYVRPLPEGHFRIHLPAIVDNGGHLTPMMLSPASSTFENVTIDANLSSAPVHALGLRAPDHAVATWSAREALINAGGIEPGQQFPQGNPDFAMRLNPSFGPANTTLGTLIVVVDEFPPGGSLEISGTLTYVRHRCDLVEHHFEATLSGAPGIFEVPVTSTVVLCA